MRTARAIAAVGVLVTSLLVASSSPASAEASVADLTYIYDAGSHATGTIKAHTEISPKTIYPGDPFRINVHLEAWVDSRVDTSEGEGCEPSAGTSTSGPLGTYILTKPNWPPGTQYPGAFEFPVSGTFDDVRNRVVCSPGSQRYWSVIQTIKVAVPGTVSEGLAVGCYKAAFENMHVIDWVGQTEGTHLMGELATLSVGGPDCPSGLLDLAGRYRYAGSIQGPLASISGKDTAELKAYGSAIDAVGYMCIRSRWAAVARINTPTTIPMLWNGQVFPFNDVGSSTTWRGVSRSAPRENGKYYGLYEERIWIQQCGDATRLELPLNLTVSVLGRMKSISHSMIVLVFSPTNEVIARLKVPQKERDSATFFMQAAATKRINI